jgi:hypothetical protein
MQSFLSQERIILDFNKPDYLGTEIKPDPELLAGKKMFNNQK